MVNYYSGLFNFLTAIRAAPEAGIIKAKTSPQTHREHREDDNKMIVILSGYIFFYFHRIIASDELVYRQPLISSADHWSTGAKEGVWVQIAAAPFCPF
jgi:hypothetical protein